MLYLIVASMIGCSGVDNRLVLEGVWRSDRKLTIENFVENTALTAEKREFLEANLGKMFLSFRGNEARVFFSDIPEAEVDAQKFEVIRHDESNITIRIEIPSQAASTVTYYFSGECIYLVQIKYGYNEYFCRYSDT